MEDQQPPRSVQAVFEDYKKRREGLVKALTTDVDIFYEQCDPEKENLCLYGFPDGTWEVQLPADEVPPELPEPALGINFARDGMRRNDWLALVAVHSDAWLMAVAFYYGAKFGPTEREELFQKINELPTVYETQSGKAAKKKGGHSAGSSRGEKRTRAAELLEELGTTACVKSPSPGRILSLGDDYSKLHEKKVELMWPDDGYWYRAIVQHVKPEEHRAYVLYVGGEYEDMDLDEIAQEGHCNILEQ